MGSTQKGIPEAGERLCTLSRAFQPKWLVVFGPGEEASKNNCEQSLQSGPISALEALPKELLACPQCQ